MIATAKIFKTGSSQAVRLPKAFYLEGDKVWISKDDATGIITLTPIEQKVSVADVKARKQKADAFIRKLEALAVKVGASWKGSKDAVAAVREQRRG